jgi:hypothetical protein
MELEKLFIVLGLDNSELVDKLKESSNKLSSLTSGLAGIGGGIVAGGVAAAGAGIASLTGLLYSSAEAAADSEDKLAQLNSVLTSTGGVSGMTVDSVSSLADSLSSVTKFEDEAIISAESMLLTFTNIGKDVFPNATETVLDMSQALGQDLKSSSVQLGKALNDPINGITALSRVGVTFTDEQKDLIKTLVETGDTVGAQKVILEELNKEFGGSAKAAGSTFTGVMERIKNTLGNLKEVIGGAVLPVLTQLGETLITKLNQPETIAFITNLATTVSNFALQVITWIPQVITTFQNVFNYLIEHKEIIVGVLAAMGVAVGVFVWTTVIPAITATVTAMAPVLAVLAAVALAAGLLYLAWDNNFLGIRDTLTSVWNSVQPVLATFVNWLQVNIPLAMQMLSDFWNTKLLPVFTAIRTWVEAHLVPLFSAMGEVISAVVSVAFTALSGIIQNVVVPAVKNIFGWFNDKVLPILKEVGGWINSKLTPAFEWLGKAIDKVSGFLSNLANKIKSIKLPNWMKPGSPMPLDWSFRWLGDSISDVANKDLPTLNRNLNVTGDIFGGGLASSQSNLAEKMLEQLEALNRKSFTKEELVSGLQYANAL